MRIYPKRDSFLQTLRSLARSNHTILAYDRDLFDFFSGSDVDTITTELIQAYILRKREEGLSPSSITRKVSAISFYCKVFDIPINLKLISRPSTEEKEAPFITEAVFNMGILKLKTNILHFFCEMERGYAILLFDLLYNSGLRVAELQSLTKESICLERNGLLITGKGNKTRFVPLPMYLLRAMSEDPLFFKWLAGLTYIRINRAIKKFFGPSFTPHSFRHGYATRLVNSGVSENTLKQVMGHSSYITTLRYIHGNEETIRREVFAALREI